MDEHNCGHAKFHGLHTYCRKFLGACGDSGAEAVLTHYVHGGTPVLMWKKLRQSRQRQAENDAVRMNLCVLVLR